MSIGEVTQAYKTSIFGPKEKGSGCSCPSIVLPRSFTWISFSSSGPSYESQSQKKDEEAQKCVIAAAVIAVFSAVIFAIFAIEAAGEAISLATEEGVHENEVVKKDIDSVYGSLAKERALSAMAHLCMTVACGLIIYVAVLHVKKMPIEQRLLTRKLPGAFVGAVSLYSVRYFANPSKIVRKLQDLKNYPEPEAQKPSPSAPPAEGFDQPPPYQEVAGESEQKAQKQPVPLASAPPASENQGGNVTAVNIQSSSSAFYKLSNNGSDRQVQPVHPSFFQNTFDRKVSQVPPHNCPISVREPRQVRLNKGVQAQSIPNTITQAAINSARGQIYGFPRRPRTY